MCIIITLQQYSAAVMYHNVSAVPCINTVLCTSTVHQLQLNMYLQVFFTPAITEAGFTKVKMPADLFQKVRNWYLRNHDRVKRVESDGGPLYNQRVIPTWHTPLPGDIKQVPELPL